MNRLLTALKRAFLWLFGVPAEPASHEALRKAIHALQEELRK